MMQADRSHLPLKLNTAGVIPPIFASSLLLLPLTITQFAGNSIDHRQRACGVHLSTLNQYLAARPAALPGALCRGHHLLLLLLHRGRVQSGGDRGEPEEERRLHPRHPPGQAHRRTISTTCSTRITVIGAIYLTLVCVVPEYMIAQTGIQLFLGGTSLLIVVNVTVDTISQIQSHLLAHQYGDLIKKAKLKGRLR